MSDQICWNCLEELFVETGSILAVPVSGPQTAITTWFGYSLCRTHALRMLNTLHHQGEIGPESLKVVGIRAADD